MNLVVFGDSHARYCFDRIVGAEIRWLGPVTMHRVGRDGAWFLSESIAPDDLRDVLCIFGEIDVRCHIGRVADTEGKRWEDVVTALATRYLEVLEQWKLRHRSGRVIVSCVPPPADGDGLRNSDFPVYGTWADRAAITRLLNEVMEKECIKRGLGYLDFYRSYASEEGYLKPELSDGSVHIARAHIGQIVEALKGVLGREIAVLPISDEIDASGSQHSNPTIGAEAPSLSIRSDGKRDSDRISRMLGDVKGGGVMSAKSIGLRLGRWARQFQRQENSFGFDSTKIELHGAATLVASDPIDVGAAQPSPWSYLASWPNSYPVSCAIGQGVIVELDVDVISGAAELGLVASDFSTFLDRATLSPGRNSIQLRSEVATATRALVLRCGDASKALRVKVLSLRSVLVRPGPTTTYRGFVAKSAMDDLQAKLSIDSPVIVDVGANRGDLVFEFAAKFPKAQIWALEPHPETFAELSKRCGHLENIHLRQMALSGDSGIAELRSFSNSAINAFSAVASEGRQFIDGPIQQRPSVIVNCRTLGDFISAERLSHIDILKLDTQGHEEEILRGGNEYLEGGRVRFVLTELIFARLYRQQASPGRVISLLEAKGFKLLDFFDFVYDAEAGLKWGDALFEYSNSGDAVTVSAVAENQRAAKLGQPKRSVD